MGASDRTLTGRHLVALLFPLVLGGCASNLIEVRKGSEQVAVAEANAVDQCKRVGTTTVSVLAEVGFISRGVANVDANLLQLARNEAVSQGGDTIVPGARPEIGKRTFAIYKCRP
ncbi:DUF4156 domain-containing protein [Thiobacillus sedimenti]|uniref:DUF4156 domain-containing protein n=1 Tax=Thiobacillus sedimenti TaxID=3110231 RepID=A0ABZ1CJD1_9PROT|nr:DUF4156 domain-containing protein [Thiobacillus sp. SCUT-2]WRS38043.1 DUF4156 domain-containing protein [Thiobacillus sp. SCUT-2]